MDCVRFTTTKILRFTFIRIASLIDAGCAKQGGDCFRWMMEIEKVPFPEAMESLALRARLEIPKKYAETGFRNNQLKKTDSFVVVEWAVNLMIQALRTSR